MSGERERGQNRVDAIWKPQTKGRSSWDERTKVNVFRNKRSKIWDELKDAGFLLFYSSTCGSGGRTTAGLDKRHSMKWYMKLAVGGIISDLDTISAAKRLISSTKSLTGNECMFMTMKPKMFAIALIMARRLQTHCHNRRGETLNKAPSYFNLNSIAANSVVSVSVIDMSVGQAPRPLPPLASRLGCLEAGLVRVLN